MEKIIQQVFLQIQNRIEEKSPNSYSYSLFQKGTEKILKKIGEEFLEVALATEQANKEKVVNELADLFYHIFVLMVEQQISPEDISNVLEKRFGISGIEEKTSRKQAMP